MGEGTCSKLPGDPQSGWPGEEGVIKRGKINCSPLLVHDCCFPLNLVGDLPRWALLADVHLPETVPGSHSRRCGGLEESWSSSRFLRRDPFTTWADQLEAGALKVFHRA